MPPLGGLKVVRSRIHGYGVVATRPFYEGEVIAEVDGVALRLDEVIDDEYCLWVTDELYFDMVDQTRWINHSCSPNGEVETDVDDQGTVTARIVAVCDIAVGEEISYDYGFPAHLAIPCQCASPECRGLIIDATVWSDRQRAAEDQVAGDAEPAQQSSIADPAPRARALTR